MENIKETARLILLQVDHNRECGKDDKFTIEEIADIINRRVMTNTNTCTHSETSSWGRLVTCMQCGEEWIENDR